jgi:hypothetical protein|uniref:Uncharacterized protein n=1 Tax=viral metagenome TaxID=1070528 RepID=A0A6C0M3H4_9ZZZZ
MEIKVIAVLFLVIGVILGSHLFCGCTTFTIDGLPANVGSVFKESFSQRNQLGSDEYGASIESGSNWEMAAINYAKQVGNQDIVKSSQYYKSGPIPLPPGEMLIFAENDIKPECCPSYYSSSTGCVCIAKKQQDYLNQRGGNRTLNSEY